MQGSSAILSSSAHPFRALAVQGEASAVKFTRLCHACWACCVGLLSNSSGPVCRRRRRRPNCSASHCSGHDRSNSEVKDVSVTAPNCEKQRGGQ